MSSNSVSSKINKNKEPNPYPALVYELENQILDKRKHLPLKLFQLISENAVKN